MHLQGGMLYNTKSLKKFKKKKTKKNCIEPFFSFFFLHNKHASMQLETVLVA